MFFTDSFTTATFDGKPGQSLVFSASDLVNASTCEFATLMILDEKLGRTPKTAITDDAMLERTAGLGDAHELAVLDDFRAQFGEYKAENGTGVYEVSMDHGFSSAELRKKNAETVAALKGGADVVFQASFFDGEFYGRADFLLKQLDGSYAVYDTKLARHAKVTALLQLAAYADQLEVNAIPVAPQAGLILGTGEHVLFDIDDIVHVFRERRERFKTLVAAHGAPGVAPVDWWHGSQAIASITQCGRCDYCTQQARRFQDVLLVAGLSTRQRARLAERYGIRTINELATYNGSRGNLTGTLAKLQAQAAVQIGVGEVDGTRSYVQDGSTHQVSYKVTDTAPLERLPLANEGDIFFDFEGDPLWQGTDGSWGIEYLFGVVETPLGFEEPVFRPFWAHSRAQERQALIDFLDYVQARRAQYPSMRIYHYANYEKRALRDLAAKHGVGEDAVDQLLRENVLVDLYETVRNSLRISENSYSIKKLEPLYMGENLRGGEVKDAGASVVAYANYCQAHDAGRAEEAAQILESIADYNRYDCVSTLELRNWLLSLAHRDVASELATEPEVLAVQELLEASGKDEEEPTPAERALQEYLESLDTDEELSADDQAIAMVASATGYHRRERKQFWWDHFDRLSFSVEDWEDTRNTLIFERLDVVDDWHVPPRKRSQVRRLSGTARMADGSSFKEGESGLFLMYENPLPEYFEEMLMADAQRFAASNGTGAMPRVQDRSGHFKATLVEVEKPSATSAETRVRVVIEESLPKTVEPFSHLPIALTPASPIRTAAQEESLAELALTVGNSLPTLPHLAGLDILRRRAPRLTGGLSLPRPEEFVEDHGSLATVEAMYRAVKELDHSYIAVQGPPGSGKTFVGSQVIAKLLDDGWNIGVVAQSHAVVENMLAGCIKNGKLNPARIAKAKKKGTQPNDHGWQELDTADIPGFLAQPGTLFGGTAWDFANSKKIPGQALDLLVIDEAGQYSLANTLAVARASKNMLLLGDPQQLPQVTQGSHPYPVDESALGWLSAEHPTLPENLGYFLGVTWRMHPDLCAPVSVLSYEGKLTSAPHAAHRELSHCAPGVYVQEISHAGNTIYSPEEARETVRIAREFIGQEWTPDTGKPDTARPIEPEDILVVAAYNAQVDLITEYLVQAGLSDGIGGGVHVGTVDKFQGQEAPVVIVSMAASSAGDSSRGAEFLLSPNRLNVAISRGQWCAIILRSTTLTNYLPTSPQSLNLLGRFVRLSRNARKFPHIPDHQ